MAQKILVVDDDEIIRSITQDDLELCGYVVASAVDGVGAWEMIDRDPTRFDLMLLDKMMPRMGGIELLRRIRADGRFNEMPVVMMTSDDREEEIAEGLAAGAYYYLIKPAPQEILKQVIRNALEEFSQKRELRERIGQRQNNLNLLKRANFVCRTLVEAKELALLLADMSMSPERTVSGYSELLINAVEHGNLGISYAEKSALLRDDRWELEIDARLQDGRYCDLVVHVSLEKTPKEQIVTITDQGQGFNWAKYLEVSPDRAFDLHGRGIAMARSLSFDRLEYLGNGNSVTTTVKL